jgi:hypothetical protein
MSQAVQILHTVLAECAPEEENAKSAIERSMNFARYASSRLYCNRVS